MGKKLYFCCQKSNILNTKTIFETFLCQHNNTDVRALRNCHRHILSSLVFPILIYVLLAFHIHEIVNASYALFLSTLFLQHSFFLPHTLLCTLLSLLFAVEKKSKKLGWSNGMLCHSLEGVVNVISLQHFIAPA